MIINKTPVQTGNKIISLPKTEKEEIKDKVTLSSSGEGQKNESDIARQQSIFQKGKEAFMKGAVQTSEYLDSHSILKDSVDTGVKFFKTIKAFPSFIYPSLINMSAEEQAMVISTLDKLPMKDINAVKSIKMDQVLPDAAGLAYPVPSSPFIRLSREQMNISENWAKFVTTHEVGHTRDFETALFGLFGKESSKAPWGKPPYISDYASTEKVEDFAESFATYYRDPEKLKAQCPEKYARLQQFEKASFFEKLIDNEAFRETGKFMGENLQKVPYLQNGLAMISYISGFLQAYKGLGEMRRGEETGDAKSKMDGTLDFAAGLCFASKVFCIAGMAIDGTKTELDRAIKNKEITAEQGNTVIEHTVGLIAGPVGKVINWVLSKIPGNEFHKIDSNTVEGLTDNISAKKLDVLNTLSGKELTGKEMKKLLGKLGFDEEEISQINDRSRTYSEVKNSVSYKITDSVIENLHNMIPEDRLDLLASFRGREFNGKELDKALKELNLTPDALELVKIFSRTSDTKPEERKETGSLKKAAGIAIGAAAGSTAGGFIGPYLGVMGGFALAGPIGGVLGLIAGAIAGVAAGSRMGGKIGKAAGGALDKLHDKISD